VSANACRYGEVLLPRGRSLPAASRAPPARSSWRGSCELTGARVIGRSMPVTQLAPWTTRFLPLRSQSLSSLMEGLQTTEPASSLAADQQFHLVANSLAQLLETATRELARDRLPRRRWSQHRTSCKRRSSAVPALTAPQGAVWLLGKSLACELTLTAIYTAPFTSEISVLSRVGARRTSHVSSNWLLASRHMPTW